MIPLLLAALLAAPARAETAAAAVERVMGRVDKGVAAARGKDKAGDGNG